MDRLPVLANSHSCSRSVWKNRQIRQFLRQISTYMQVFSSGEPTKNKQLTHVRCQCMSLPLAFFLSHLCHYQWLSMTQMCMKTVNRRKQLIAYLIIMPPEDVKLFLKKKSLSIMLWIRYIIYYGAEGSNKGMRHPPPIASLLRAACVQCWSGS